MDLDRFQALAEAFGGRLETWPIHERAPAAQLLAKHPDAAAALKAAATLDAMLDDWAVSPPSARLMADVLLHAPRARSPSAPASWLRRPSSWTSGAGLMAAGLIGVLCGAAASTAALADGRDQALVASAAAASLGPLNTGAEDGGGTRGRAPAAP